VAFWASSRRRQRTLRAELYGEDRCVGSAINLEQGDERRERRRPRAADW